MKQPYNLFITSLLLLITITGCSDNAKSESFMDEKITVLENINSYAFQLLAKGTSNTEAVFESIDYRALKTNSSNDEKTDILQNSSKTSNIEIIGKIADTDSYLVDYSYRTQNDNTTTERLKLALVKDQFIFQGLPITRYYIKHANKIKIAEQNPDIKKVHPYAIYRLVNGQFYNIGEVNEINYLALIKSNIISNFLIWEKENHYGTKSSDNSEICSYEILKQQDNIFTLLVHITLNNPEDLTQKTITKQATMELLTSKNKKIKTIRCLGWQIIKTQSTNLLTNGL